MRCNHGAAIFFSSRYIRGIIDVSELCRKAIGGGGGLPEIYFLLGLVLNLQCAANIQCYAGASVSK